MTLFEDLAEPNSIVHGQYGYQKLAATNYHFTWKNVVANSSSMAPMALGRECLKRKRLGDFSLPTMGCCCVAHMDTRNNME